MTRKVVTRAPHREVGMVNAGWLLDHPVEHESFLEKRFIMVALSCPVVTNIVHQPKRMKLNLANGQEVTYTPDFEVTFEDGSVVIVEVKPEVFVDKHHEKHEAAASFLSDEKTPFLIITDKIIDRNHLSARAILLMRYGRMPFSKEQALDCKRTLEEKCDSSTAVRTLIDQGVSEELIWHMVAKHEFSVLSGLSLTPSDEVQIHQPQEGGCNDYFQRWLGIA